MEYYSVWFVEPYEPGTQMEVAHYETLPEALEHVQGRPEFLQKKLAIYRTWNARVWPQEETEEKLS